MHPSKWHKIQTKKPSLKEFEKQEDEGEELVKDKLEEAIKDSKKVQKKAKELKEKLLQKKEADWQDKKELEKLMEQQKAIEEKVNEAKEALLYGAIAMIRDAPIAPFLTRFLNLDTLEIRGWINTLEIVNVLRAL